MPAQTKELGSFHTLMRSLATGHPVRAVIHDVRCNLVIDSAPMKASDAIGEVELRTYEHSAPMSVRNPKAFLSNSEAVLIARPRYRYVYNSV